MKTCNDCGVEYPYLQKAHILAKHKGGTNDKNNIVLICPNCHYLRDHDERIVFLKKAWTPERREKQRKVMRENQKGRWMRAKADTNSPEAQASRSESMKKQWETKDWSDRNKKVSEAMKGNKNGLGNSGPPRLGWGNGLECCQICQASERPHKAKGLCNACYLKIYRGHPLTIT